MKQNKIRAWIHSFRLRTLPLSSAGAILGGALAFRQGHFDWTIAIVCLITILLLQILSNMANDLGDTLKGTDNQNRVGPLRAVQSGEISPKEMKRGILICVIMILLLGTSLLLYSFTKINYEFLFIFLIGVLGILAAIKYTIGKKAYGYYGFGDIFVFFFFGWIPVGISYFIQTHHLNWEIFLPGLTIGLLSTAVLNVNNLRDFENDKQCHKKTLVVKFGILNGKKYHTFLIIFSLLSAVCYTLLTFQCLAEISYILAFIPLFIHLKRIWVTKETSNLDPELKKVALSTILLVLLWTIGFIICIP